MPAGGNNVVDLIMQLMSRGRSGGLPMQASPELTQYLAHAQGGTAPPQMRGMPSADVLPGPGSAIREIQDPNFLSSGTPTRDIAQQQAATQPMDMLTDPRPPTSMFRQESPGEFDPGTMWIWYTHPKTGQRIKLDGPFTDDIQAHRAMQELRREGVTEQLEVSPY